MKVLHLLETCSRGGAEMLVLDICKNLPRFECESYFVTFHGGPLEESFRTSIPNFFKLRKSILVDIGTILSLRKIIREKKINVVHSHFDIGGIHARLAIIGLKVTHFQSYHGFDHTLNLKFRIMLRIIVKIAEVNLFVSDFQKKYYSEKYKFSGKEITLYNFVDVKKLEVKYEDRNIRDALRIDSSKKIISMVGNFNDVRDQLTVCKAFNLLCKKRNDVVIVFAGRITDDCEKNYNRCFHFCKKNSIDKNVFFLGSRNDVPNILKHSDLFVYSTVYDTFGIAIIEAMMMGIPVLANECPVFKEITGNGELITFYKSGDCVEFANRINEIIAEPFLFKKTAQKASVYAINKYSIDSQMSKLIDLYRNNLKN